MMSNVNQQQINSTIPSFTHYTKDYNISYNDQFVTEEQKQRDTEVTKLLRAYVKTYEKKVARNSLRQDILFGVCLIIIGIFTVIFTAAIIFAFLRITSVSHTGLATIITASVSFISLIIGLLTIITKYFFPENDEQYITKIVETIQQNDLKNKKENAKNVNPINTRINNQIDEHQIAD